MPQTGPVRTAVGRRPRSSRWTACSSIASSTTSRSTRPSTPSTAASSSSSTTRRAREPVSRSVSGWMTVSSVATTRVESTVRHGAQERGVTAAPTANGRGGFLANRSRPSPATARGTTGWRRLRVRSASLAEWTGPGRVDAARGHGPPTRAGSCGRGAVRRTRPEPRGRHGRARAHLRSLAHGLRPVVQVGADGFTEPVIQATSDALAEHDFLDFEEPYRKHR